MNKWFIVIVFVFYLPILNLYIFVIKYEIILEKQY